MTFKSGDTANKCGHQDLHIKFWREQKKFDFWLLLYKKLSLGEMSLFPSGHQRSEEARVLLKWCKYHSFLEILGTVIKLNDLIVSEETLYVLLRYFPFFSQHRHFALTSLTVSESQDRLWSNKTTMSRKHTDVASSVAVICWWCVSSHTIVQGMVFSRTVKEKMWITLLFLENQRTKEMSQFPPWSCQWQKPAHNIYLEL